MAVGVKEYFPSAAASPQRLLDGLRRRLSLRHLTYLMAFLADSSAGPSAVGIRALLLTDHGVLHATDISLAV